MNKNVNKNITFIIMALLILEAAGADKKENHIHINEFPQDTISRTYTLSMASITASPTTDYNSASMMKDYIKKLQ